MSDTVVSRPHPGLLLGIGRFVHDPRGATRAMLDSAPTEARLLFYGMLAAAMHFVGRTVQVSSGMAGEDLHARIAEQAVSLLFFLPLLYYGLATAVTGLVRLFGRPAGWFEGRCALFWAAVVSAPFFMISAVCDALFSATSPGLAIVLGQVGGLYFAWALAQSVAEVFGYESALRVLAVIFAIIALPLATVALLGAG